MKKKELQIYKFCHLVLSINNYVREVSLQKFFPHFTCTSQRGLREIIFSLFATTNIIQNFNFAQSVLFATGIVSGRQKCLLTLTSRVNVKYN